MKPLAGRIVDSHMHLDLVQLYCPERIDWLKEHQFSVVSWAYGEHLRTVRDVKSYLTRQAERVRQLHRGGLDCYFLTGIHPRNITPDLEPGQVADLLQPFLQDTLCLGIGEIGLETGSEHEHLILMEQLRIARRYRYKGKKAGIHTPRSNKLAVTIQILKILEAFSDLKNDIVIDHCTLETLSLVLFAGYRAGITLSPIKTSWKQLPEIVEKFEDFLDCILCNTDSGRMFYEDLLNADRSKKLNAQVKQKLLSKNAADFFLT